MTRTEAAIYVHADAEPAIRFIGRSAEAIARDFPKGGLIPAHQLPAVFRWAGEGEAARSLFAEESLTSSVLS